MRTHWHMDPQTYFESCYGINHKDAKPMLIKIKVYGNQVDYIKSKSIQESQEEIEMSDGWSIFNYWLRPSDNFYQALLWHREKL